MSARFPALGSLVQRTLISIDADASATHALATARTHQVHHLPVMHDGTLVGLACTCNLEAAAPGARVDALMRQPAITLGHAATLADAVAAMNTHDVGSLILVEDGRPCGIITRGDLLLADPELAFQLDKSRCACCGLTRHLSTDQTGQTFCIYCLEPGADGRINHISAE